MQVHHQGYTYTNIYTHNFSLGSIQTEQMEFFIVFLRCFLIPPHCLNFLFYQQSLQINKQPFLKGRRIEAIILDIWQHGILFVNQSGFYLAQCSRAPRRHSMGGRIALSDFNLRGLVCSQLHFCTIYDSMTHKHKHLFLTNI